MKVIIGERGSGKTDSLIKMSNERSLYIVCSNHIMVDRVARRSRDLGVSIPFPITFHEFESGQFYPRGIRGFLIDDIDTYLLNWMYGSARNVPIEAITLTIPDGDSVDIEILKGGAVDESNS